LTSSFRPHYGPGVDSASNRNEYQEYFLWGKGGRCVGLTTLPPSCADCLEIWEPQRPGNLRACTWIAVLLPSPPGTSVRETVLLDVASHNVTPLKTSVPRSPSVKTSHKRAVKIPVAFCELLTSSKVSEQRRKVSAKCWQRPDIP